MDVKSEEEGVRGVTDESLEALRRVLFPMERPL